MDSDYERQLEADIDRELKGLPEVPAPRTLAPRVMSAIAARTAARSYRRSWSSWPLALRTASLAGLLALFGGLCVAVSALPQSAPMDALGEEWRHWFSGAVVLWRGFTSLPGLFALALKHIDTRLLLAGVTAAVAAYAACVALATCSFRLGLARVRNHLL